MKPTASSSRPAAASGSHKPGRLRALTDEYRALAAKLMEGGGAAKIKKQHESGKLTARERIA